MTAELYGIYGAGGCGRGIMPCARDSLIERDNKTAELVFIDDRADAPNYINGQRVMSYRAFCEHPARRKFSGIAIADGSIRARIAHSFTADGVCPWTVTAKSVVIMDDVVVDEGALISPNFILTSNIRIGRHFHGNLAGYVEHDCVIGDFVTFAPSVHCNGNVVIEDFAYIGAGAIIRQGTREKPLRIGRGAVVGMGAVVTKDVPAGQTVAGNPARPLPSRAG